MFLRTCLILSFILLSDLPPSGDRFELIVGYQAGIRNETRGLSGLASIVSRYLASTPAARSLALSAYAAGGEVEFFDELDRTAMRISVPGWAKPMLMGQVEAYFKETPDRYPELVERARSAALEAAAAHKVEDEIRIGLLGSHPYHHPVTGWRSDIEQITSEDVVRFFSDNYGTDHAFVLMTSPALPSLRQQLLALPVRTSKKIPESTNRIVNAERIMHFPADGAAGAVIFASPVPGVYYRSWYAVLMLDRLARRTIPGKPQTMMVPSLDPYYWRLEVPVPGGQFAETVEESLLQEINRLQFSRAKPDDLEAARRDAAEFLNSRLVREWFASLEIENHRQEGLQWLKAFSADDMRVTARDFLVLNRVIASWSPKPKQNTVQVESLNSAPDAVRPVEAPTKAVALGALEVPAFPAHAHPAKTYTTPEKLSSGVWLAASSVPAIFLSGPEPSGLPEGNSRTGPNGTLWTFTADPDANTMRAFQKYRADRILVLAAPASMDRARSLWGGFKPNERDATVIAPQGKVANIDLPALIVLKAALDRRLIEAGWWHDGAVRIDAALGATLEIEGSAEIRARIAEWIKDFAASPMPDAQLAWAREVAIHHLDDVLPDVQSLLWQRVPDYILQDLQTIAATHVQDVAKLYF